MQVSKKKRAEGVIRFFPGRLYVERENDAAQATYSRLGMTGVAKGCHISWAKGVIQPEKSASLSLTAFLTDWLGHFYILLTQNILAIYSQNGSSAKPYLVIACIRFF